MELGHFFGSLHPLLVHAPLALLPLSIVLEMIGFLRRDARFTFSAQILMLLGVVALLFAFVCGNFAEIWAARDGVWHEAMEAHEGLATLSSWLFVFLGAGRLFLGDGQGEKRRGMAAYLLIATLTCGMLVVAGHRGAMLVYERGAGVQAPGAARQPTHEDLEVLLQRQTDDALFYSNVMHHAFGWMVLALSLMLMADLISPQAGARLRKLAPAMFVIGGILLMIFSNPDAWPMDDKRSVWDREVLLHKIYAVIMIAVGLRGMWSRRGETEAAGRQLQGRMIALFALVGGAMLFTHVHSNAPFANVAVGVYLHHIVMGSVALAVGLVKLLEDALPPDTPIRRTKAWNWMFPSLLFVEAILLVKYNEGLPWFLGYRDIASKAARGGSVTHLGRERAEMTFDPKTQQLDIYLIGREDDRPRPIEAESFPAILRVGTDTTLLPLNAVPEPEGNWHFRARASFLRGAPLFQTRLFVPRPGRAPQDAPMLAEFEPYVDESHVAKPVKAAYLCPMHPNIGAEKPEACSECGMTLVKNRPPRPWDRLSDDEFKMELALAARPGAKRGPQLASRAIPRPMRLAQAEADFTPIASPEPGQKVRLTFTPRRADGSPLRDLDVVHTKKLHLILVSEDLSFFDHIHPEPQSDGTLVQEYAFPGAGNYFLFADMTPTGDRNQVFRLPVTVAGSPPPKQPLSATPTHGKLFGNYRVALTLSPHPPIANDETQLVFTITENGVPVTDIEPFLGASGHCVVISQDTRGYLHSHPIEMQGTRYGPKIVFHTQFPRPGLYKIWGQFQHRGKPITADFVIRIN